MNFFTNKRNLAILFIVAYGISLLWLSSAWYKSYTTFHWFNDFFEWEYLDKLGHIFTSFYLGLFAFKAWGNPENLNPSLRKKWICFSGLALLLPIEILDGFSMNYGASAADIIANTLGSIYCYAHVSYKVFLRNGAKVLFFPTVYSSWRPELLGSTFTQQVLKDYNGQTYWLSIDINSILGRNILPNWLMLTIGYGAQGLLGGDDNVWKTEDGKTMDYTPVFRTKQIFISIDVNATVLRSKNKMFSYLFAPFVLLKFPAPAIEINTERGIVFHLIYF